LPEACSSRKIHLKLDNSSILNATVSCPGKHPMDYRSVLTGIVLGLISLGTVFGNCLVLLAVALHRNLRSTTGVFVSNLAAADLLLGACVLPFSSALEVTGGCWHFGNILCDIWASVDVLCCTASIMSLCVISMERYIGVTRPLQHASILTHRRAVLVVLFVWLLSLLVSVGPLIGWKKPRNGTEDPYKCEVSDNTAYIAFSVTFSFYLPLCVIIFFYIRVYQEAVKQTRFLTSGVKTARTSGPASAGAFVQRHLTTAAADGSNSKNSSAVVLRVHRGGGGNLMANSKQPKLQLTGKLARFKREKKAAKTLGIVVGVFILCWLPFFFIYPFKTIVCQQCQMPDLLFKVAFWLGYCNSLCNPVIYACWNREFKRAFGRILACQLARRGRSRRCGWPKNQKASDSCQSNNCHSVRVSGSCVTGGVGGVDIELQLAALEDEDNGGAGGAGPDTSYFPKCSLCPSSRPQSPLIGLSRR
uniref:G_PROTEIN_RECEP_F1_2 domain-containing protein n=1 Tax=Macrostomum lignano TaxID=282301 RepID=A0A1I8H5H4_9PLAT